MFFQRLFQFLELLKASLIHSNHKALGDSLLPPDFYDIAPAASPATLADLHGRHFRERHYASSYAVKRIMNIESIPYDMKRFPKLPAAL